MVKAATNCSPRSDTTEFSRPWSFQTWWRKRRAEPSAVTVVVVGIKWTCLETELTTVITASYPADSRSSTTKSTGCPSVHLVLGEGGVRQSAVTAEVWCTGTCCKWTYTDQCTSTFVATNSSERPVPAFSSVRHVQLSLSHDRERQCGAAGQSPSAHRSFL